MMSEDEEGQIKSYPCRYQGQLGIDKRYNFATVMPWLLAEVQSVGEALSVRLDLTGRRLTCCDVSTGAELFSHRLNHIRRFIKSKTFRGLVAYIYDPEGGCRMELHGFMMSAVEEIDRLYKDVQHANSMAAIGNGHAGDASRSSSIASTSSDSVPPPNPALGNLDALVNKGHQVCEVLYLGTVRLRSKTVDNFDDVIHQLYSCLPRRDSAGSGDTESPSESLDNDLESSGRRRRQSSICSVGAGTWDSARNALLVISPASIRLYNMALRQLQWERPIRDVASILSSYHVPDHIGLVAECDSDSMVVQQTDAYRYSLFIFQCASKELALSTFASLKQTFLSCQNARRLCDLCPVNLFNRLCEQLSSLAPEEVNSTIADFVMAMEPKETDAVEQWMRGCDADTLESKNEMLVALLRNMCDSKQASHEHQREPEESEIDEKKSDLLSRAKKSFLTSLKSLSTVSKKPMTGADGTRVRSNTASGSALEDYSMEDAGEALRSPPDVTSPLPAPSDRRFDFPESASLDRRTRPRSVTMENPRSRSATLDVAELSKEPRSQRRRSGEENSGPEPSLYNPTSLIDYDDRRRRRSNSGGLVDPARLESRRQSMRYKIFTSIVTTPQRPDSRTLEEEEDSDDEFSTSLGSSTVRLSRLRKLQRSRERYRALWRKAISEIRMLIRMEKKNAAAAVHTGDALLAGLHAYEDVSNPPSAAAVQRWKELQASLETGSPVDSGELRSAVRSGVPRARRADAWRLLMRQHQATHGEVVMDDPTPYRGLIRQLTVHQHAIIIDVGRTFPSHPLFSDPENGGQLSLFNILKAYSLLDKEIGYCQGISFIVGVLLMHMSEEDAFEALKFIMYDLDYRQLFTPDMAHLQVCLYQFSRLIHDHLFDLHHHLERHSVSPSFYAAPWFLSLFATQYALGFVARAFDLLFCFGEEAVFRLGLILLSENASQLMQCTSFESICDCLRSVLPTMSPVHVHKVLDLAFRKDIRDDLRTYAVEYRVLNEEMMATERSTHDYSRRLQDLNRELARQKRELSTRYEVAERVVTSQRNELDALRRELSSAQSHLREMRRDREKLRHLVGQLRDVLLTACPDPGDALGEKLAIELAAALS